MDYLTLKKFISQKINHSTIEIVGSSVLKRNIYAVCFDFSSKHTVIIQGAIHAREHITTDLICKLIEDVSINYLKHLKNEMPNLIFIPMVNPDGVELVYNGIKSVHNKKRKSFLLNINGSEDFSLFKALDTAVPM